MNNQLNDKMRVLAEKIEQLPATGMIEAERAHAINSEMLEVLMDTVDYASERIEHADRLTPLCERLQAENDLLRQRNNELAFIVAGIVAWEREIEGHA